jgi:hypothetical protein
LYWIPAVFLRHSSPNTQQGRNEIRINRSVLAEIVELMTEQELSNGKVICNMAKPQTWLNHFLPTLFV